MQKPIIALNQSPIQYGIILNAINYVEKYSQFCGQNMLYYQFTVSNNTAEVPAVPDGCIDLIYACNPLNPHAILYGTVLRGTTIRFEHDTLYFGIRFTPMQSMTLRGFSFREVVNSRVSLIDLSKECVDICSHIANRRIFEERIAFFEQTILPRIFKSESRSTSELINRSLECIYHSRGEMTMKELSSEIGYSPRYLRLQFEEHLGISPKLFSRIIRFQNSLAFLLDSDAEVREVPIEQNFYDQSHFLKEFREFSPLTPRQIRKMRETNHVQVHQPENNFA